MRNADHSSDLLRRLILAMLDEPEGLVVDVVEDLPKREIRILNAAEFDRRKIIGKDAAHIVALRYIAHRLGRGIDEQWNLVSRFPAMKPRGDGEPGRTPKPDRHSITPDLELITEILIALFAEPPSLAVKIGDGDYVFQVTPMTQADAAALWAIDEFDHRELNLLTELGTLFRSIGRRQGVTYRVEDPTTSA